VTLWEHREASKRLHEEGRRSVDEHVSRISLSDGLPVAEFDALPASASGLL
jgi:hypothetical protein